MHIPCMIIRTPHLISKSDSYVYTLIHDFSFTKICYSYIACSHPSFCHSKHKLIIAPRIMYNYIACSCSYSYVANYYKIDISNFNLSLSINYAQNFTDYFFEHFLKLTDNFLLILKSLPIIPILFLLLYCFRY